MTSPCVRFGVLSVTGIALLAFGAFAVYANEFVAWLIAVNIVDVVMYRYDKAVAGSTHLRVPEIILHALTLLGGAPGSALAMWGIQPRHKTQSPDFLLRFYLIVALQVVALVAFLFLQWNRV